MFTTWTSSLACSRLRGIALKLAISMTNAICSAFSLFKESLLCLYVLKSINQLISDHLVQICKFAMFAQFSQFYYEFCDRLSGLKNLVEEFRLFKNVIWFVWFFTFLIIIFKSVSSDLRLAWPKRFLISLKTSFLN